MSKERNGHSKAVALPLCLTSDFAPLLADAAQVVDLELLLTGVGGQDLQSGFWDANLAQPGT